MLAACCSTAQMEAEQTQPKFESNGKNVYSINGTPVILLRFFSIKREGERGGGGREKERREEKGLSYRRLTLTEHVATMAAVC